VNINLQNIAFFNHIFRSTDLPILNGINPKKPLRKFEDILTDYSFDFGYIIIGNESHQKTEFSRQQFQTIKSSNDTKKLGDNVIMAVYLEINDTLSSNFKNMTNIRNRTANNNFIITMNDKLFYDLYEDEMIKPTSYLLSTKFGQSYESIDVNVFFKRENASDLDVTYECGFWKDNEWQTYGCYFNEKLEDDIYWCKCNHTTFFALLAVNHFV
jgi:hypothetical protein